MRIGHGFDVHAFGGDGPIIIGGVRIPWEKGLLAHSDGDVALHALTDALLGAAALGDIGKLFPDTPQMRVFIAEDLGCHMDDVNVKATTTEKLGFTGRGEGIACEAVALLLKAAK